MVYRKDVFDRQQFLAALRLCFPARAIRLAVASNHRKVRDRLWPQWLLVWTLIAWFFEAKWGLPAIVRWLRVCGKTGMVPSEEALYQARKRLGYKPLWWIRRRLVHWLACPLRDPTAFFRGRRLLAFDGVTFTMADTPANDRVFGRANNQHKKSGYPLMRVAALCELGTHALVHWVARHYRSCEKSLVARLLRFVPANSLVLGDRNFHSYHLWEQAQTRGFALLLRVASGPKFPVHKRLPDGSYLSEIRPRRCAKNRGKSSIVVRVIVYEVWHGSQRIEGRLVTNLLSMADGTARELVELYQRRWEQESAFKEVKSELAGRVTHLRGQTPTIVLQELDALLLGHYVVRSMILQAARQAGVPPIEISFTQTIRIIQMRLASVPRHATSYGRWFQALIDEIAQLRLRPRRSRSYPRVRKVVRCAWGVKRPHHRQQKLKPLKQRLRVLRLS